MKDNNSPVRRWYDRDPILAKAMKILETSNDKLQIQVAINLIKIIIEHNIDENAYSSVDDIIQSVEEGKSKKGGGRWYDIDYTLRTAIQMLENCSQDTQNKIAHQIANLVTDKMRDSEDEEEF